MEKNYKKCEICSRNTNEKYLLARFPLDKERCKKWVKAVGIPELARLSTAQLHYSHFVCGKHFSDNHYHSENTRLKLTAIPTLHLPNPPLSDTLLENFPCKKLMQLPGDAIVIRKTVTLHVENGVTAATNTYNVMDEHNYSQQSDPSKCGTITQTDTVAEDKKSDSTPICSSAVDMSENENRKEMRMENPEKSDSTPICSSDVDMSENENRKEIRIENPGATNSATDADIDDTEDCSAPICSSPVGITEDQTCKKMEINGAVLTWQSPDPTPSNVQPDVSHITSHHTHHSSNRTIVTITNPGPTTSSVQSAAANHSYTKYYYYLTNTGPTTSSIPSTVAKRTSRFMRRPPVAKVDNEVIKKLRADLIKHYNMKTAQKLKETRIKLREAQKKLSAIENIKSPLLKSLIESEISNRKKKAKGKRWSTFSKCVALALYKRAPQAYTYLEKLLPLPSTKTLQKVSREFEQGAAMITLEQLMTQTEESQAVDSIVLPSADTVVEPLPHEE